MARTVSIATGNPARLVGPEHAARIMTRRARRLGLNEGHFLGILANTQIGSRYTVLGDELDAPLSLTQRNDTHIEQALLTPPWREEPDILFQLLERLEVGVALL